MRILLAVASLCCCLPAVASATSSLRGQTLLDSDREGERELMGRKCDDELCNLFDPDGWCRCEGGDAAYAISFNLLCYDDFEYHCVCSHGYRQTKHECEFCYLDNPNAFCQSEDPNAFAKGGQDCYDDFEDHCDCAFGYRKTSHGCEECHLDNPNGWCQRMGGPEAFGKPDESCYDDFEDDCDCNFGFRVTSNGCKTCNLDDKDGFCRRFSSIAFAIPDKTCYDDFEDDCDCPDGYLVDDDTCELDCHTHDPDAFCVEQGGDGAFAIEGLDCYLSFTDHCSCFDGYDKTDSGCSFTGVSMSRQGFVQHVGNDNLPLSAYPMGFCQGDCDEDEDCAGNFVCFMRDGNEPVPGCKDGELEANDYDYCIPPPTPSPTTPIPTFSPVAGQGVVQFVGNDGDPQSTFPLALCQGDCDDDDDCAGNLVCFMREENEPVPGCQGGELEAEDYDYCVFPPTPIPTGSPTTSPTMPLPTTVPIPSPTTLSPTSAPTVAPATSSPTTLSPTTNRPSAPMRVAMPLAGVPALAPFTVPMPETPNGDTMYDARYIGRFQQVQESGCSFPFPVITAGCGGQMGMVNVSDPSIVCGATVVNADNSSQITCTNTCVGDTCQDIFLGNDLSSDTGDLSLFGDIFFQCQGGLVNDAAGWLSLSSVGGGSCNGTALAGDGVYRTAQLGVYDAMIDNYRFDDKLFECDANSLSASLGGVYSCMFGRTCNDAPCKFAVEDLNVTADLHRFTSETIRTNDRSPLPVVVPPAPAPTSGDTTAQFQVNLGFFYNEEGCDGTISGLVMTCIDGTIALVENQSGMDCLEVDTNSIQCDEGAVIFPRNQYGGVLLYNCTSIDQVPQTIVENSGTTIDCTSSNIDEEVAVVVQLGAVCGGDEVMYDDIFFECGESSALISGEMKFTCGVAGVVPQNAGEIRFAPVGVETDFRWGMHSSDMCLDGGAPSSLLSGLITNSESPWIVNISTGGRAAASNKKGGASPDLADLP